MDWRDQSKKIDEILDKYLADVGIHSSAKPPSTIFHYTDAKGFKGIVENKEIWMTNASYLNDASEVMYGRRLAAEELYSLADRQQTLIIPDGPRGPGLPISSPRPNVEGMIKRSFLANAGHHLTNAKNFEQYIASFCLHNNLLSQWRAYGKRGGGFSLGFNVSGRVLHQLDRLDLYCFPVIYNPDRQRALVKGFVDEMFSHFENCLPSMDRQKLNEGSDHTYQHHEAMLINGLIMLGLTFKDPGFEVEHEYRLMLVSSIGDTEPVNFRDGGGHLIPYVKLNFDTRAESLNLASVTCGPGPDSAISRASARMILDKYEFGNVPVVKSEIPLRA